MGQSPFIRDLQVDNSHIGHVLAIAPRSACIINKTLQLHQSVATCSMS